MASRRNIVSDTADQFNGNLSIGKICSTNMNYKNGTTKCTSNGHCNGYTNGHYKVTRNLKLNIEADVLFATVIKSDC